MPLPAVSDELIATAAQLIDSWDRTSVSLMLHLWFYFERKIKEVFMKPIDQ